MKVYRGSRHPSGFAIVAIYVDGEPVGTVPHLVRHSPTGFEWGYGGSGPADLARCILIEHFGAQDAFLRNPNTELTVSYQGFKDEVIAKLPKDADWEITEEEVQAWVEGALA